MLSLAAPSVVAVDIETVEDWQFSIDGSVFTDDESWDDESNEEDSFTLMGTISLLDTGLVVDCWFDLLSVIFSADSELSPK